MSLLTCMTSHPPLASTAAMPAGTAQTGSGLVSVLPTRRGIRNWKRHWFILARLAFADKLLFGHALSFRWVFAWRDPRRRLERLFRAEEVSRLARTPLSSRLSVVQRQTEDFGNHKKTR